MCVRVRVCLESTLVASQRKSCRPKHCGPCNLDLSSNATLPSFFRLSIVWRHDLAPDLGVQGHCRGFIPRSFDFVSLRITVPPPTAPTVQKKERKKERKKEVRSLVLKKADQNQNTLLLPDDEDESRASGTLPLPLLQVD